MSTDFRHACHGPMPQVLKHHTSSPSVVNAAKFTQNSWVQMFLTLMQNQPTRFRLFFFSFHVWLNLGVFFNFLAIEQVMN